FLSWHLARNMPAERADSYPEMYAGGLTLGTPDDFPPRRPSLLTARQSPVRSLYCAVVSATTDRRPCLTRGESANSLLALISARLTGWAIGLPALIFTRGFRGSLASTETTDAVPTTLLWFPVS